ncbi:MAG: hypothetical protein HN885_01925, partial [Nitrospina sp.]|nr:hypothetical protein [Nitrospina sp.]
MTVDDKFSKSVTGFVAIVLGDTSIGILGPVVKVLKGELGIVKPDDILLISDGVDPSAISEITSIVKHNGEYRLSILGVGTENGAPIPLGSGGFVKDTRSGNVIIPKLNISDLRRLASANNGNYQTISNDDRDIDNLLGAMESLFGDSTQQTDRSFD